MIKYYIRNSHILKVSLAYLLQRTMFIRSLSPRPCIPPAIFLLQENPEQYWQGSDRNGSGSRLTMACDSVAAANLCAKIASLVTSGSYTASVLTTKQAASAETNNLLTSI
ncbi:hypothetical protein E2C01_081427 [Portunus trituberculatus]|uniref:Uncharacterized protein n=1 Tax=Portunus trituberculatus TaxID=210409 RepID=A0A5B7IWB0_PORTR|nr:hypothetical protein [Portunus trituberculatus]